MKHMNKFKIVLIGLVCANTCSVYGMGVQETSIHPIWYFRNSGVQARPSIKTQYRTITDQLGATENAKIPQKTQNILRVATYNVHFWCNPFSAFGSYSEHDLKQIVEVIRMIDADVLILQEVGGGKQAAWHYVKPEFDKMGYKSVACASIGSGGVYKDGNLYNCIYSKFPFAGKTVEKQYATNPDLNLALYKSGGGNPEQRSFVGARIQLPNKKEISVYTTHLEVRPIMAKSSDSKGRALTPDAARKEQIQELLEYIKNNDTNPNVIIGADFNTFRKQDLDAYNIGGKTLWSILEKEWPAILKETVKEVPQSLAYLVDKTPAAATSALDYVVSQGYKDSFTVSKSIPPQFTAWTGTMIDFLFLSPRWNLGTRGGYAFYSWKSDHIPVIMDIDLSKSLVAPKPTPTKTAAQKAVRGRIK